MKDSLNKNIPFIHWLNQKILNMIEDHPEGGEHFFDDLDEMIRNDKNILDVFLNHFYWYHRSLDKSVPTGVILSGHFGQALLENFDEWLHNEFDYIVCVSGGLRQAEKYPEMYSLNYDKNTKWIFMDDSYYSGGTRNKISKMLQKYEYKPISETFVIYDGSKKIDSNVHSMFRYYNQKYKYADAFPIGNF